MATGDLTDLATCYLACGMDSAPVAATQTILGTLITAISAFVPQVINRNILADNYIEIYNGNGKSSMLLRQRPVLQITAVSWQGQTIAQTADPILGTMGMWTDGRSALLVGYCFPQGMPVRVAYSAGYITVPADISLAVAELVAEAYARRSHVGETSHMAAGQVNISFDQKAMHAAIMAKLSNYRHGAPC